MGLNPFKPQKNAHNKFVELMLYTYHSIFQSYDLLKPSKQSQNSSQDFKHNWYFLNPKQDPKSPFKLL